MHTVHRHARRANERVYILLQPVAEGPVWGRLPPPGVQGWRVFSLRRQNRALPVARAGLARPHDWCALYFVGALCKCMGGGMLVQSAMQWQTCSRAGVAEACALAPAHLRMQSALPPMHCEVRVPYIPRVLGALRTIGKIQARRRLIMARRG